MPTLNVNRAEFIRSAADPGQFIRSSTPSVAFAGKSNVGKSSVINRLLNRKNLARVGAQPGKTIHVNYFKIGYFSFQRDFLWDPSTRTLNFKLKRSEIKDGKLRLLATADYTHAGQPRSTEFSMTLTIASTEKTTFSIEGINVSPR